MVYLKLNIQIQDHVDAIADHTTHDKFAPNNACIVSSFIIIMSKYILNY